MNYLHILLFLFIICTDELLLLKRRLNVPSMEGDSKMVNLSRQRDSRKAPDLATIRKATAHLAKKNTELMEEEVDTGMDVSQRDSEKKHQTVEMLINTAEFDYICILL